MRAAPIHRALALLCCLVVAPLLATAAVAQQAAPKIVGIGVTGCVDVGDRITVRGSGFGRAGGRALMLRAPNVGVELPVTNWTDRSILATVPEHSQLTPGKWYELGIQEKRSGKWLTNQRRPLQICPDKSVSLGSGGNRLTAVPRQTDPRADPSRRSWRRMRLCGVMCRIG